MKLFKTNNIDVEKSSKSFFDFSLPLANSTGELTLDDGTGPEWFMDKT